MAPGFLHVKKDSRVLGLKLGDGGRKQERGDGGAPTHPNLAPLQAQGPNDVAAQLVVAIHDGPALLDREAPDVGQFDTAAAPDDQRGAEIRFQLLKSSGESGLAHVDGLGRVGDGAGVGDREQRAEQDQIHQHAILA